MTDTRMLMMARAVSLANRAHAGQTRHGGAPFVRHPVRVSAMLSEHTDDFDIVVSGVLHDVIEDSRFTKEMIERATNSRVAELVCGVTDPMELSRMSRQRRKLAQAQHYVQAPRAIRLLKLADQTDNLETVTAALDEGRHDWVREYTSGALVVAEACREACPQLYARARRAFDHALERLGDPSGEPAFMC